MATTKTNVTIAFIGPYRWLPGLKYNGTLVTNDIWTAVNMTNYIYDFFQPTAPGVFYWCDIAGDLAIQAINANDSLLPNIHINIKRYNDAGPPYKSPGYTLAHTMPEIIADQDVIAIFADFDRKVTGYSGEVMSIAELPFCGIETFSFKMLNRYKYPYLMQMMTMAGIAQATYLLLQQWNVRRMAIIYSYSNNEWTSQAYSIIDYISRGGVTILTQLNSDLVLTPGGVDYLASMLQLVDARYIMIVSDVYNIADVYYSLANRNASVGPDYVWLGNFPPVVNGDGTKIYGPNFFKLSRGFIFIAGGNMPTQYSSNLMNTFTAKVNNITAPLGANPSPFNIGNINMAIAYDCAGLLASGFQKVLTSNPQFTPQMLASRKLNAYMNSTLFENTGYRGISGDPMIMGPGGDLANPYFYQYLAGSAPFPDPIPFAVTDIGLTTFYNIPNQTVVLFDGTANIVPDGPIYVEQVLLPSNTQGKVLTAIAGIGIVFSCCVLLVTLICRRSQTIRNGSVLFLSFIAVGSVFPYASIFYHLYRSSTTSCNGRLWLPALGFSIVFGSIFVKNMRMHIIFTPEYMISPKLLKDWVMITAMCVIVGLEGLFIGLWTSFSPLKSSLTLGNSLAFTYSCVYSPHAPVWPTVLLWVYNALLLIGTLVVGMLTWNVKPQFNESTYIYLSSICVTIISLLLLAFGQSADTSTFSSMVQAIGVWFMTTFTMLLLFGPKLLLLVVDTEGGLTSSFLRSVWKPQSNQVTSDMDRRGTNVTLGGTATGGKRNTLTLDANHAPGRNSLLGTGVKSQAIAISIPCLKKFGVSFTIRKKNGLDDLWRTALMGMYQLNGKVSLVFIGIEDSAFSIKVPTNVMIRSLILKDQQGVPVQYRVELECVSTKLNMKIDFDQQASADDFLGNFKQLLQTQK